MIADAAELDVELYKPKLSGRAIRKKYLFSAASTAPASPTLLKAEYARRVRSSNVGRPL